MSDDLHLIELTSEVVSAYVSNNPIAADQLGVLIQGVHSSMLELDTAEQPKQEALFIPAISIKKSVQNDHIVCLDCGRNFKSIKRHLGTSHGLTPEEYRQKWNLKPDYPVVAPAYAKARSKIALDLGLGRKSE